MDGGVHDWQREEDEIRTAYLEGLGYHILRFRNAEVLHDLPNVLTQIADAAAALAADRSY